MTRWGRVARIAALVGLVGCNTPPAASDAAGIDGSATSCGLDRDCDDGLFCNGRETCLPGSATADVHGCVAAGPACTAPATCNEGSDACITGCLDADGDGHGATECGGDDCDDTAAGRYPGNAEVCDAADVDEDCDPTTVGERDLDGDGVVDAQCCNGSRCGLDCDDIRRDVQPSSPELCDALDNDCDGAVDEGLLIAQFLDGDHDGIGDASRPLVACPGTPGISGASGDCDDTRASVRPTAPEICDALDNDCDTTVDEETVAVPWYVDADGDGWGLVSPASPSIDSCVPPAGRAIRPGDCDDGSASTSPSSAEQCNGLDDDCNGRADYFIAARDGEDDDGDGYPDEACHVTPGPSDCNDGDRLDSVPGTPELCDFRDNDCDGRIDEDTAPGDWFADVDGDGHGDPSSAPIRSCTIVAGRVRTSDDCDDHDRGTYPGAVDSCLTRLGVDDDCDGTIDEGGAHITLFLDADDDGYGTGTPFASCFQDTHASTHDGDCADDDPAVSPGAHDDCTGIGTVDDDCDGRVDETTTTPNYWSDVDGDGFGGGSPTSTCTPAPGAVANGDDCDDANRFRNPMVPDDCATVRGVDDDCDGSVDEALALRDFFVDADHDGFGAGGAMPACTAPSGTSPIAGDCDDTSAMRNPAAPDDCSRPMGVDDDCDGRIDEMAAFAPAYRDVDGDGYGTGAAVQTCGTLAGYAAMGGDCNESSVAIHPGQPDDCSTLLGVDDDCDGMADENVVTRSWYADADHDGYGVGTPMMACAAPTGFVASGTDCDDGNASRSPGRVDDCTGVTAVDDDCDMRVDEARTLATYYRDADNDGYGDPLVTQVGCSVPSGYVAVATDCDDAHASARPGGTESVAGGACADAIDNDCDTRIDCSETSCASAPGCGNAITVLSGDAQSAILHTSLAAPLVVRLTDGMGSPLVGRTLSLATTSVSAVGYSAVTDGSGQASFTLRAPLPIGTETFAIRALGVPDALATATATAPPTGRIFSVTNGPRSIVVRRSGPAYDASTDGAQMGDVAGGADGNLFYASNGYILRVRSDGAVEPIVGGGAYPPFIPEGGPASSAFLDDVSGLTMAYDQARGVLYFTRGCGIYAVDLSTRNTRRVLGAWGTCGYAGDGGRALDATSNTVFDIAVSDSGIVYFTADSPIGRVLRRIDSGGAVSLLLHGSTAVSGVDLGVSLRAVAAVPGSDDVIFGIDCRPPGLSGTGCVVRADPGGNVSVVVGGTPNYADGAIGTGAGISGYGWDFTLEMLPSGEIVVVTYPEHIVRRIDTSGRITTIAGTRGTAGDTGDGGASTSALVRNPAYPTAWRGSHLVFLDAGNHALRAIW